MGPFSVMGPLKNLVNFIRYKGMMESVEFLPVEVTKEFMGLTVGDILRVNPKTGNYELHSESEDIGDNNFSHEKYEISLQPWIIDKYSDHFQIYDDKGLCAASLSEDEKKYLNEVEETYDNALPDFKDDISDDLAEKSVFDATPDQIAELKKELAELKEMFNTVVDALG